MSDICRVCLSKGELVSLFRASETVSLSEKVMSCASVQIEAGDRLPSHICLTCVSRVNASYDFKILCEFSDITLRKRISGDNFATFDASYVFKTEHPSEHEYFPVKCEVECDVFKDEAALRRESKNERRMKRKMLKEVRNASSFLKSSSLSAKEKRSKKNEKCTRADIENNVGPNIFDDNDLSCSSDNFKDTTDVGNAYSKVDSDCRLNQIDSKEDSDGVEKFPSRKKCRNQSADIFKKSLKKVLRKPNKKHQCFTCGKVMSSKFRLQMHVRIHTGEKPFTCNFCNKTFTLAQNLKVHERVHTGEKPLLCGVCGKAFAQSAGLATHMRLHTGETPYKCTLCPSSFRTPGHLQYHIKQHTGEKNFKCSICSRAFISKGDLTQHSKTHTGERPYVCTICGLRMARSSHLTRHMMTHTGEKPHKCEICGSCFAQKGDVVRHVNRRHAADTGEKPHKCDICGFCFSQKYDLIRHVKRHTLKHSPIASDKNDHEDISKVVNENTLPLNIMPTDDCVNK
ncbi:uncharacterized protein LOC143916585 isoform X2 [Arctopsyche grandis]|uniref:uncharacterized protein LOC143916585 isoform X2 n=1 Tax=Arctopsyche grandis TaxID=121162 RepID=UPI00406D9ABF